MDAPSSPYLLPVSEYMTSPVLAINPDASLHDAERRLEETGVSCLAVCDVDERLVGVISRTDILRVGRLRAQMGDEGELLHLPNQTVRARMISDVVTADLETPLKAAADAMLRRHIHRVFVVEHGRPVGVLSTRDLMRAVIDARTTTPLSELMSHPVVTIDVSDTAAAATDKLADAHVRGLVVVEETWPVGVFTQTEALEAAALPADTRLDDVMSCALLCLPMRMPVHRAAAFALETRARRVCAVEARDLKGIMTGLDFARVVAAG